MIFEHGKNPHLTVITMLEDMTLQHYFTCLISNVTKIGPQISSNMGYRSGAAEGASPGSGHMAGVLLVRVASGPGY